MEDYKNAGALKLSEEFIALWESLEKEKRGIENAFKMLALRQSDMIKAVACQLQLDPGVWDVDSVDGYLVKKEDISPEGSR